MPKHEDVSPQLLDRLYAVVTILAAAVYYFSNPKPQGYYDYTFRVAANILGGNIAFTEKQPSWLNEFVPFEGFYYSVFPFGSVLTMIPFALLKVAGLISDMPAAWIASGLAGVICLFLFLIGRAYDIDPTRLVVMALGVLFGTWMWTNLTMAGAWQLALGFAMVGELGAIYFTVYDRRPLIAGLFFALAFGNRTENLLTAPIFFWLLYRSVGFRSLGGTAPKEKSPRVDDHAQPPAEAGGTELSLIPRLRPIAFFCAAPFVLGTLTLVYNYVRFHSFTDFGYARIPGVLNEPWYNHGIFSYHYIPRQMWEMMWKPWETRAAFPYLLPDRFSSSIFWSSPFILFAFRFGSRDQALKYAAWIAVLVLCILLWIHGNSGGWQFGYRYAMVCLPWLFVIMLESAPKKITPLEWAAYGFSFAANAYATWLFHWTEYMK
ncbi:MAG TPA: hypothetical protein VMZ26_00025 [Pyrinomonadaceae bacterium]|nr:hypothetical protein [Pyrinomonadaceae bacterium]